MAEYKSFHYLMHPIKEGGRDPNQIYIKAKAEIPPTFEELWPTTPRKVIFEGEKSYWRTGHCLRYIITEDRAMKSMVISAIDTSTKKVWRPLVVDLSTLYPIVDPHRTRKDNSGLGDSLYKAATDYLLSRLKVTDSPIVVPDFWDSHSEEESPAPVEGEVSMTEEPSRVEEEDSSTVVAPDGEVDRGVGSEVAVTVWEEDQVFFQKSYNDSWENLEVPPPDGLDLGPSTPWVESFQLKLMARHAQTAQAPSVRAVTNDGNVSVPAAFSPSSEERDSTAIETAKADTASAASTTPPHAMAAPAAVKQPKAATGRGRAQEKPGLAAPQSTAGNGKSKKIVSPSAGIGRGRKGGGRKVSPQVSPVALKKEKANVPVTPKKRVGKRSSKITPK